MTIYETEPDEVLMDAVRAGDTRGLGILFERHQATLYRYFFRMTGNSARSEDLTQEVFTRMLRRGDSWRPGARFSNWMYRIARNTYIDGARKQKWEAAMPENMEVPAPREKGIEESEQAELIRQALMLLPPEKRELLVLSRYQELKYHEIGELLGVESGTVKVRVFRAIAQLRDAYQSLTLREAP